MNLSKLLLLAEKYEKISIAQAMSAQPDDVEQALKKQNLWEMIAAFK